MSVILGVGYTFYPGAVEAWLVDALHAANFSGQLDQVFARGAMVSGAAMLIGTVSGGLLGSLDLAIPFVVRAALLAIVFGMRFIRCMISALLIELFSLQIYQKKCESSPKPVSGTAGMNLLFDC